MSEQTDPAGSDPYLTLETIELTDETVVMLTQADDERAWIQSDTVVTVEP